MTGLNPSRLPNEQELVARIQELTAHPTRPEIIKGIGDDCAVIDQGNGRNLLITTDAQVEGVHFRHEWATPAEIGYKALAVNVSDIAAMGGSPTVATVSLVLAGDITFAFVEQFYEGVLSLAHREGIAVVGGNLSRTSGPLTIDITLLGTSDAQSTLYRSGASIGDSLFVTGWPGLAGAGLRALLSGKSRSEGEFAEAYDAFLRPQSLTRFAKNVAESGHATSAIDTSDGLGADIKHLCEASSLGVMVTIGSLPVHPTLVRMAGQYAPRPIGGILSGGEDYALLFTTRTNVDENAIVAMAQSEGIICHRIGTMRPPEDGLRMLDANGQQFPLPTGGWDHFDRSHGFEK